MAQLELKDQSKLGEFCNCPFCLQPATPWGSKGVGCMTDGCPLNGLRFEADDWNRRANLLPEREPVDMDLSDAYRNGNLRINAVLEKIAGQLNVTY